MRREQRRAERMKELEEALAEEEETEPEKQEFLAGTKLTPPCAEREEKPVPAGGNSIFGRKSGDGREQSGTGRI